MDDLNAFDRQLANVVLRRVGPPEPVDDAALFSAITATQSPKRRFQTMFSATKFVVAGVIVALFGGFLLAGVLTTRTGDESVPAVGASVSASPHDAEAMAPSVFALRLRGGGWGGWDGRGSIDPDTGFATATVTGMAFEAIPPVEWDAASKDDPSAASIFPLARQVTSGPGDADPRALGVVTEVWVKDEVLGAQVGSVIVERRSTRLENDGGAWVGRATVPGIGVGVRLGTAFWELVGEGGYEGLTMFLWGDFVHRPGLLLGIIVPSDSVPDFPPLPDAGAE